MAAQRAALALALLPALAAARCSKVDESCLETGCCSTPKTKCFKKNDEAAFCRLGCEPGIHMDDPKEYRTKWSCEILTFGCSVEWQPCEGAEGQKEVVPCCQTGCVCNYTSKYFHQCVPPEGESKCSKDGPEKAPDFGRAKASKDEEDEEEEKEEEEEEDEEEEEEDEVSSEAEKGSSSEEEEASSPEEEEPSESSGGEEAEISGDCFKVGGVLMGPDCPQDKAEVLADIQEGPLAQAAWRPSHLALLLVGVGAASGVVAAAAAALLFRRNRRLAYSADDVELSMSEEETS